MRQVNNFTFLKKNHVIGSRKLTWQMKLTSCLHEWMSVVLKQGVVIVKNRTIVKCSCEETFGSLVRKSRSGISRRKMSQVTEYSLQWVATWL